MAIREQQRREGDSDRRDALEDRAEHRGNATIDRIREAECCRASASSVGELLGETGLGQGQAMAISAAEDDHDRPDKEPACRTASFYRSAGKRRNTNTATATV